MGTAVTTEYLTAEQIADELNIHVSTVRGHFRSGGLPGRKVGHSWTTTRGAFDAWLTGQPKTQPQLEGTSPAVTLETKDAASATSTT